MSLINPSCIVVINRHSTPSHSNARQILQLTLSNMTVVASVLKKYDVQPLFHLKVTGSGFSGKGSKKAAGAVAIQTYIHDKARVFSKIHIVIGQAEGLSRLCRLDSDHVIRKWWISNIRQGHFIIHCVNNEYGKNDIETIQQQLEVAFKCSEAKSIEARITHIERKTAKLYGANELFKQLIAAENPEVVKFTDQFTEFVQIALNQGKTGKLIFRKHTAGHLLLLDRVTYTDGSFRDVVSPGFGNYRYVFDVNDKLQDTFINKFFIAKTDLNLYNKRTAKCVCSTPRILCIANHPNKISDLLTAIINQQYYSHWLSENPAPAMNQRQNIMHQSIKRKRFLDGSSFVAFVDKFIERASGTVNQIGGLFQQFRVGGAGGAAQAPAQDDNGDNDTKADDNEPLTSSQRGDGGSGSSSSSSSGSSSSSSSSSGSSSSSSGSSSSSSGSSSCDYSEPGGGKKSRYS